MLKDNNILITSNKEVEEDKINTTANEEQKSKSRLSTAKSSNSTTSNKSLLHQASESRYTYYYINYINEFSLLFDPNEIVDDNSVIADLVKTNL